VRRTTVSVALVCGLALASPAAAYESDNFTCRSRPLRDSLAALDEVMNARIQSVLARVKRRGAACDATCLFRELQAGVGGSERHPLTGIPHSRFERWIGERPDVDRCRLEFRDSIYGARPYNQPWLFPFTGRVILLADSIRVSGRIVGIDKINHFMREGLAHWRAVARPGGNIAAVMQEELGLPRRQLRWNEYGLKGWSLTGILAYGDLAASYSGYRFWTALLSVDAASSYVGYDPAAGRYIQRRAFTFAEYVNDAWDESLNCSEFGGTLAIQVKAALRQRQMTCPVAGAASLAGLPQAPLYVNPTLR
jgi:hypothetical protein